MSEVYHNGFLHTSSSYFQSVPHFKQGDFKVNFKAKNIAADYKAALDHAKKQEQGVYQSFFPGVTTYEAFIKKLRELFAGVGNLRALSNASLKNDIIIKNEKQQFDYQIIITQEMAQAIGIKVHTDMVDIDTGDIYLDTSNASELKIIKQIINYVKKLPDNYKDKYNPFNRSHIYSRTGFKTGSSSTEALDRWLNQELQAIAKDNEFVWEKILMDGITITRKSPNGQTIEKTVAEKIRGKDLPFSQFKGSEINAAIKAGDKEIIAAAEKARQEAKIFLMNRIEASSDPTLNKAFNLAWSKLPTDFFFEGDNVIKGVLGNPSEFALDVAVNYVALKTGQHNSLLSGVIGDLATGKRGQPRSDYDLLVMIGQKPVHVGMQSKNVDKTGYNDIEANTDLGLMMPNLGEDMTTSIANYKFNASIAAAIGDMEAELGEYLNNLIWRGINFNVKDELIPEHTNTFYFLGGTMIIPVSRFILYLANPKGLDSTLDADYIVEKTMEPPETTISGLVAGTLSDEDFESPEDHPLFLEYWHGKSPDWTPLPSNSAEFQNLLGGIRVKSILKFGSFLEVSGGSAYYSFIS